MADTISTFATGNVQDNEIVKSADFQFAFESLVDNFSKFGRMVLESRQNFVIGGEVYSAGGMNLRVKPIYGVNHVTSVPFGCVSDSPISTNGAISYITIADGGDSDRIDVIGVRGTWLEYDEQQRSFRDFDTNTDTIQNTNVKKTLTLEYEVFKGENGSSTAPEIDSSFVKLAEVFVPANAIEIDEENIHNITIDVAGEDNPEWTTEKDATYNIGYISDVNDRFRQQHNSDGSHQKNIIGTDELKIGTAAKNLNASVLPIGGEITVGKDSKSSSTSTTVLLTLLASYITSLFDTYKKNGDYAFNGEVSVSDVVDAENKTLVDAFKFGTVGEDDERYAYIKYEEKEIIKIYTNGTIQGTVDYSATNKYDLVNKAITDAIDKKITDLQKEVSDLSTIISGANDNSLLSKFSYSTVDINYATVANISLANSVIVDGTSVDEGDIVLVKDQDNPKENGIYIVHSSGPWERHESFSTSNSMCNLFFKIINGASNIGKLFYLINSSYLMQGNLSTTDLVFKMPIYQEKALPNTVPMRDANGGLQGIIPTSIGPLILDKSMGEEGEIDIKEGGFYYIEAEGGKGGNGGTSKLVDKTRRAGGAGGNGQCVKKVLFLLSGTYNYIVGMNGANGTSASGKNQNTASGGAGGKGYSSPMYIATAGTAGTAGVGSAVTQGSSGTSWSDTAKAGQATNASEGGIHGGNGASATAVKPSSGSAVAATGGGGGIAGGPGGSASSIGPGDSSYYAHGGSGGGGGGNTAFYSTDQSTPFVIARGGGGGGGGSISSNGTESVGGDAINFPNSTGVAHLKLWKLVK